MVPHRHPRATALGHGFADDAERLAALPAVVAQIGPGDLSVLVVPVPGVVARADGHLGARHRDGRAGDRRVERPASGGDAR